MNQLTFPLQAGELKLDVMLSLHHQAMVDRLAAGLSLSAPLWATGVVDTGSSVTSIVPDVIQRLGAQFVSHSRTHTAAGPVPVRLFRVSLSIPSASKLPGPMLTRDDLIIMELIDPIPGVEVLIGMDILLDCRLLLDGPDRQFALEF